MSLGSSDALNRMALCIRSSARRKRPSSVFLSPPKTSSAAWMRSRRALCGMWVACERTGMMETMTLS